MKHILSFLAVLTAMVTANYAYASTWSFDANTRLIAGASWRLEDRDPNLIGKRNLPGQGGNGGLCADNETGGGNALDAFGGCLIDEQEFRDFIAAPGNYNPNADDGNLNYDKGDVVRASIRALTEFNLIVEGRYGIKAELYAHADPITRRRAYRHPDTALQPAEVEKGEDYDDYALRLDARELFFWYEFDAIPLSVAIGKQIRRWGEAAFLVPNSTHVFNPPSLQALYMPGMEIDEIGIPISMATADLALGDSLTLGVVLPLDFQSSETPPIGDFFAPTDVFGAGVSGFASLGFGKEPEDPGNLQDGGEGGFDRGCINPDGPIHPELGVRYQAHRGDEAAGRNVCHAGFFEPDETDEWGVSLSYFAEWLGNTEFSLYAADYYSRIPFTSYIATEEGGSIPPIIDLIELGDLQFDDFTVFQALGLVDTAANYSEYPKQKMFGLSFNTNIGDAAFSGEVAYRPEAPVQVTFIDVSMFALSPALGTARDTVAPSFLERYRRGDDTYEQDPIAAGSLIAGYERLENYNWVLNALYVTPARWLGVDRLDAMLEIGGTHYPNMPDKEQLQFHGNGVDTHASLGRYEYINDGAYSYITSLFIQNPIQEDLDSFADANAYGYRLYLNAHINNVLGGNNQLGFIFMHDIKGESPQPAGNFIEGRKLLNVAWNYARHDWSAKLSWSDSWGGGAANTQSDKSVVSATVKVSF